MCQKSIKTNDFSIFSHTKFIMKLPITMFFFFFFFLDFVVDEKSEQSSAKESINTHL